MIKNSFLMKTIVGATAMVSVSVVALTCEESCRTLARTQQANYCASVGGGSACATSPALFNYFYQKCVNKHCSGN